MAVDVKKECLPAYKRLYRWHTKEIQKLDAKQQKASGTEQQKITIVKKRLIVERMRIKKIYPEEFAKDKYDEMLGAPTVK